MTYDELMIWFSSMDKVLLSRCDKHQPNAFFPGIVVSSVSASGCTLCLNDQVNVSWSWNVSV